MTMRYKRSLTIIAFFIAISGLIGILSLFYKELSGNDTIVMVDNELSINYMNGYKVNGNGEFKFSVTNNGDHDIYYNISINKLIGYDSKVKYNIISSDSNISIINKSLDNDEEVLLNSILIKSRETQNFTLTISDNTMTSFELNVKKTVDSEEYFYTTILSNNKVIDTASTQPGKVIASSNEGLIEDVDDLGITYYFRGNVSNNYVSLNGTLWRIVRINGDGTVKLVLDNIDSELTNYHSGLENATEFTETNIEKALTTFYETKLMDFDSVIDNNQFCIENGTTKIDDVDVFNAYTRIVTNIIPTFNCLGNTYTNKIGLLTPDEVLYAGASLLEDNTSFYLYNDKIDNYWWTINIGRSTSTDFYPFAVSKSGKLVHNVSGVNTRGLRPVINIKKKVTVMGEGTIANPYVLNIPEE